MALKFNWRDLIGQDYKGREIIDYNYSDKIQSHILFFYDKDSNDLKARELVSDAIIAEILDIEFEEPIVEKVLELKTISITKQELGHLLRLLSGKINQEKPILGIGHMKYVEELHELLEKIKKA